MKQRNTLCSCCFIAWLVTELSSFSTRADNLVQLSTKRLCDTFDFHECGTCTCRWNKVPLKLHIDWKFQFLPPLTTANSEKPIRDVIDGRPKERVYAGWIEKKSAFETLINWKRTQSGNKRPGRGFTHFLIAFLGVWD